LIRLIVYIGLSLVITAVAGWLIAQPGTIIVEAFGYRMQPAVGVFGLSAIALLILIGIVWGIVRRVLDAPKALARQGRERRLKSGIDSLSDGFIALQAGDAGRARMLARDAQARLPGNSAARLLEARSALAVGDMPSARQQYRDLISEPKTALAALTGLYEQARAQGRHDAAITFAEKAAALEPGMAWAEEAVFNDLARRGDWEAALERVQSRSAGARDDRKARKRRIAVLETALARELEETDPDTALDRANAALKQEPAFVPAALIAGRVLSHRGETRKAASLLRRVWRATGHEDVASLYAAAQPGASAVDRLARVRDLIEMPPANRSAALVVARAAIDAYEWSLARNALANHSSANPSQQVCLLMAEIEEGQNGDQGKASEWLSRAVRAPRDPVWTADGVTADEWEPVSPISGRLDAFEWKVPVSSVARRNGAGVAVSPAPVEDAGENGTEDTVPVLTGPKS
jgi:HemY protein